MSNSKNDLKSFIENNFLLVFSIPIVFNSGFNLFKNFNITYLDKLNVIKISSLILGTFFFVYLSNFLNNQFAIGGRSIALVFYLTSYFIFDSVLMFAGRQMTFQSTFLLISFFWSILIIYKTRTLIEIFKIFSFLFIYKMFNNFFFR